MGKSLSLRRPSDLMATFDNLFNEMFTRAGFGDDFEFIGVAYPKVDLYDAGDKLLVEASVPGLSKENVRVDWQNGSLTICGESVNDKSRVIDNYLHKELHRSTFCRSFKLDERKFDVNKIEAKVNNGLLTVSVPRKDVSKFETKQIEVK